jgi:tRNA pseudouridine38-40 synthase
MRNIRLTIAYDGGGFSGWQIQPERRTVQAVLETAIRELTGESVRVFSSGRTDAGVHALGQVANFRSRFNIPPEKWRPALQHRLPDDVIILESTAVDDEFHATYSTKQKRYRYVLRLGLVEDPFLRRYAWRINGPLDVAAMRTAAQALLGTHDFRCFETDWPNKATSVRTIFDVQLQALARWPGWDVTPVAAASGTDAAGEFLVFEISGDGFLYNMVRAIVGTLVNVGRGKWPVDSLARIIAGQDRSLAGETAPAHGLYLVSVTY